MAGGQAPSRTGAPAGRGVGSFRCSSAHVEGGSATGTQVDSAKKRPRTSTRKGKRTRNRTTDESNGSAPTQLAAGAAEHAELVEGDESHEGEVPVSRGPSRRRGPRSNSLDTEVRARGGEASGVLGEEGVGSGEETATGNSAGEPEGVGSMREGSGSGVEAGAGGKKRGKRKKDEVERSVRSLTLSHALGRVDKTDVPDAVFAASHSLVASSMTVEDFMSLPKVRETLPLGFTPRFLGYRGLPRGAKGRKALPSVREHMPEVLDPARGTALKVQRNEKGLRVTRADPTSDDLF